MARMRDGLLVGLVRGRFFFLLPIILIFTGCTSTQLYDNPPAPNVGFLSQVNGDREVPQILRDRFVRHGAQPDYVLRVLAEMYYRGGNSLSFSSLQRTMQGQPGWCGRLEVSETIMFCQLDQQGAVYHNSKPSYGQQREIYYRYISVVVLFLKYDSLNSDSEPTSIQGYVSSYPIRTEQRQFEMGIPVMNEQPPAARRN